MLHQSAQDGGRAGFWRNLYMVPLHNISVVNGEKNERLRDNMVICFYAALVVHHHTLPLSSLYMKNVILQCIILILIVFL